MREYFNCHTNCGLFRSPSGSDKTITKKDFTKMNLRSYTYISRVIKDFLITALKKAPNGSLAGLPNG